MYRSTTVTQNKNIFKNNNLSRAREAARRRVERVMRLWHISSRTSLCRMCFGCGAASFILSAPIVIKSAAWLSSRRCWKINAPLLFLTLVAFIDSLREIIAIEWNFPLERWSKYLMKTSFGGLFFEFYGDFISWPWKSGLSTPLWEDFQWWEHGLSILVFGPVISASDQSANQNVTLSFLSRTHTKIHLLVLCMKYDFQGCFLC